MASMYRCCYTVHQAMYNRYLREPCDGVVDISIFPSGPASRLGFLLHNKKHERRQAAPGKNDPSTQGRESRECDLNQRHCHQYSVYLTSTDRFLSGRMELSVVVCGCYCWRVIDIVIIFSDFQSTTQSYDVVVGHHLQSTPCSRTLSSYLSTHRYTLSRIFSRTTVAH